VERCQGAGCSNFAQIASPTTTSFGDSGLIPGTTYQYRVRAADAVGNLSAYSAVANATTQADTTAPAVTATSPTNGATGVGLGTAVTVTFSEAMDATTVSGFTIELRDASNVLVSAAVTYNANNNTATLTPTLPLLPSLTYTATVKGGATDPRVKDVAGNALSASVTWSFTTVSILGFLSPNANGAVTASAGDNNGFETNPTNAYANDGLFAVDTNSGTGTGTTCTGTGKDKHVFYNYGANLLAGATIKGIQVRLDAKADNTAGAPKMCVQLSWDGGTSWTTAQSTAILTTTEATYLLGGNADTWGRTWTVSNLSDANFRVRVINVASNINRDFSLDWVAIQVAYQ